MSSKNPSSKAAANKKETTTASDNPTREEMQARIIAAMENAPYRILYMAMVVLER